MTSEMVSYRTRRATLEDLAQLSDLWNAAHLPAVKLEKKFTEFQVAEDDVGKIVAAIGLQIDGSSGRIHSETIADFSLTDTVRPALWKRLQTVAQNHGLFRVWTEETAPWWKKDAGFAPPSAEVLQKLPATFGVTHPEWLMLQLRAETADPDFLEKEMAKFREIEQAKREAMLARAKIVTTICTIFAALLFGTGLAIIVYMMKHDLFRRFHPH